MERNSFSRWSVPTLNVSVGNRACNSSCKFCVSKVTPSHFNEELFFRNLDLGISVAKNSFLTNTVLITGKGEPTLHFDICRSVIKKARENGLISELQTNGFSLHGWEIQRLLDSGLNTLSISRVAFDNIENQKIMRGDGIFLKDIIKMFTDGGGNVRLSFVALNGYNDTFEKIIKTCERAYESGASQVTFRRMGMPQTLTNESNKEIFDFAKENEIKISDWNAIIERVDGDYDLMRMYDWGTASWMIEGVEVMFTECLTSPGINGTIRYLIYDGHLRISWEHKNALLF